ncbi:MAG: citrate synthase [Armatimonadota bacterium]
MTEQVEKTTPTEELTATLSLPGHSPYHMPVIVGSEGEHAFDIEQLRNDTGYITLDNGYGNTGSCTSAITYIDGDKGVLRYRGYPIEELAANSSFVEVAWLLIYGELPTPGQLLAFSGLLTEHELLHEGLRYHFEGFPPNAHPMAMLSAMINASSCYHPELVESGDEEHFMVSAAKLMSKVRTIAAFSYKKSIGQPMTYPHPQKSYCQNFLHMMFSIPYAEYEPTREELSAFIKFLVLHADHEQNCSTSTVRMVCSAGANLFASIAAGVCALWGPLHGGANQAAIEMLHNIYDTGTSVKRVIEQVKEKQFRLMGFGHRVYKSYDPRAAILKEALQQMVAKDKRVDPLMEIALELEASALTDDYFISRNLYPNVDFYSGLILRRIGIPVEMFTVMFALGRIPGWIAHWYEQRCASARIMRPRQVYMGPTQRRYVPLSRRNDGSITMSDCALLNEVEMSDL